MGTAIDLDVIRANVWRVMQLRTFLHSTSDTRAHTHATKNTFYTMILHYMHYTEHAVEHLLNTRRTILQGGHSFYWIPVSLFWRPTLACVFHYSLLPCSTFVAQWTNFNVGCPYDRTKIFRSLTHTLNHSMNYLFIRMSISFCFLLSDTLWIYEGEILRWLFENYAFAFDEFLEKAWWCQVFYIPFVCVPVFTGCVEFCFIL